MKTIQESYWKQFQKVIGEDKSIGDGIKFEDLVEQLLLLMYGKKWERTKKTHDNNRDFWTTMNDDILWAECKNYNDKISMQILAPTLIMAQIYEATTILFFSHSEINVQAKKKILLFGEQTHRHIIFFDGVLLNTLLVKYESRLPKNLRPNIIETTDPSADNPSVSLDILSHPKENVNLDNLDFIDYTKQESFCLGNIYTLSITIENHFIDCECPFCLRFVEEKENIDRYRFEYLNNNISKDSRIVYEGILKAGETFTYSIMIRPMVFKQSLLLPRFEVAFDNIGYSWISESVHVKCIWTGRSGFIGSGYIETKNRIINTTINKNECACIILSGQTGTGKTRTMEESLTEFYRHGYKVLRLTALSEASDILIIEEIIFFVFDITRSAVTEALNQISLNCDGEDYIEISPDVNDGHRLMRMLIKMQRLNQQEKLHDFVDRYGDLIFSRLTRQKCLILIDNAQFIQPETKYFIEKWLAYSINTIYTNPTVTAFIFNSNYMTSDDKQFIDEILHMGIRNCFFGELHGFANANQSIMYIQELLRLDDMHDSNMLRLLAEKNNFNPYYIFQGVRLLEEKNLIIRRDDTHGYLIVDENALEIAVSQMTQETSLYSKFKSLLENNPSQSEIIFRLFSLIYILEEVIYKYILSYDIPADVLYMLSHRGFIKESHEVYSFDHDAIRLFFASHYKQHLLDAFYYIHEKKEQKPSLSIVLKELYEISVVRNKDIIIESAKNINKRAIPKHIEQLFIEELLENCIELIHSFNSLDNWLDAIRILCSKIRNISGSISSITYYEEAYSMLISHSNSFERTYSTSLRFFLHSYIDVLIQTHNSKIIITIQDILERTKNISPNASQIENDERIVIRSIMYNRWYNVYGNMIPTEEITIRKEHFLKESRNGILKIKDIQERNLIEYINNSDEGYQYYGYNKDAKLLYQIWGRCIIKMPQIVPEKTLNYYRKCVQFNLIEKNTEGAKSNINLGRKYLLFGEYSHDPLIFNAFFDTAEIMVNLQRINKDGDYNEDSISKIIMMHKILGSTKIPDLLWLQGIVAFYRNDRAIAKQYLQEAYDRYNESKTARNYWIKLQLIDEDIKYISSEYDNGYMASGIIRTYDDKLNLPLLS